MVIFNSYFDITRGYLHFLQFISYFPISLYVDSPQHWLWMNWPIYRKMVNLSMAKWKITRGFNEILWKIHVNPHWWWNMVKKNNLVKTCHKLPSNAIKCQWNFIKSDEVPLDSSKSLNKNRDFHNRNDANPSRFAALPQCTAAGTYLSPGTAGKIWISGTSPKKNPMGFGWFS